MFDAGIYLSGPLSSRTRFAVAGRHVYRRTLTSCAAKGWQLPRSDRRAPILRLSITSRPQTPKHHAPVSAIWGDDALDFILDEPINADPALRGDFGLELASSGCRLQVIV